MTHAQARAIKALARAFGAFPDIAVLGKDQKGKKFTFLFSYFLFCFFIRLVYLI